MDIRNYGTLHVCHDSKRSDKAAWNMVEDLFGSEFIQDLGMHFDAQKMEIEFEEHLNSFLDDDLRKIQDGLKPHVWLEGNIAYYGDYDGWIDVKRTGVESGDKSSEDLHYATDETLIAMLENRGYVVTKAAKEVKK